MDRSRTMLQRHGAQRLRVLWAGATPEDIDVGCDWYPAATRWIDELANANGHTRQQVAALAAVYSPRVQWEKAKEMTVARANGIVPATLGLAMRKAERIMAGEDPATVVGGPKVTAFYHNLIGDLDWVTIDTWSFEQVTGKDYNENKNHRLLERVGMYQLYATCFRIVARDVGLEPASLQAVLWTAERNQP